VTGSYTEEEALLKAAVDRFVAAEYSFDKRRSILSSDEGFSRAIWAQFAELGLLGAPFDEQYGGGGSPRQVMTIMEAFGRGLVLEPYVSTVVLGGGLLRHGGSDAQKSEHIPQIVSGQTLYAFAYAEPTSRFNLSDVSTTALADGDGYILSGKKIVAYGAPSADYIFVSARTSGAQRDADGVTVFLVAKGAKGLSCRGYATIDGMRAGDVTLDEVRVPASAIVGQLGKASGLIDRVIDDGIAAICAEAVGAMAVLNDKTVEHTKNRVAFGQTLSKFQVLQHRMVDMRVAHEHAEAMAQKAYLELDREPARRALALSAVKAQVSKEAVFVGRNAIQLHGAIGITDELDVSHYFKRLTSISNLFGNVDHHLRRYVAHSGEAPKTPAEALEKAAWLPDLTDEEIAFRDEVRAFYSENLTDELREAANLTLWHMTPFPHGRQWQQILNKHGYGAVNWPVEYGGKDWTFTQRLIWNMETARARAPQVMGMGREYCAPCIMKYGTDEQKEYFLPKILSGEDFWAQGYSEPGAGSDLASLQLAAHSEGDDYILNGSKIWTTFAHNANRIFALVRTATGFKKQVGISFLLIDLDTPGIEIRPIVNLAGDHDFNEVFFTNVRVPKSRRLGLENDGWSVARHLLLFEHGVNLAKANLENIRRLGWLRQVAALEQDGGGGAMADDPDFSRHIAEVAIGVEAMDFASQRHFARTKQGDPPNSGHELLTLRSKELGQRLTELAMEAVAYYGLVSQPQARRVNSQVEPVGPRHALLPMPFYLTQRGATIAGGTPEIHRNNLARHLLHL
jgi:alkylation response protein AidB-like acyl-CoA dehydrogenase